MKQNNQKKRRASAPVAHKGNSGFYRFAHGILAKFFLWLYRVRVRHAERQPKDQTYLLCCNHISAMDPILLAAALSKQQTHFMAKKELFRIPVLAQVLRALNSYPVDRAGDVGAIKTSIALIEAGNSVGMFPQGTRCPDKEPRETVDMLKNGAGLLCDKTHVCVLPVCLRTKGNKLRIFRGAELIVGEPIPYEQLAVSEDLGELTHRAKHAAYARISCAIFERICALYEEETDAE